MLAAAFKSAPAGFYETGNTKAAYIPLKHPHTMGVPSLANVRRKESQEKHEHSQ